MPPVRKSDTADRLDARLMINGVIEKFHANDTGIFNFLTKCLV